MAIKEIADDMRSQIPSEGTGLSSRQVSDTTCTNSSVDTHKQTHTHIQIYTHTYMYMYFRGCTVLYMYMSTGFGTGVFVGKGKQWIM